MIGAAGPGGSVATSQIQFLNEGAWAALVSKPAQVAAITPAEVERLAGTQIIVIGTNIKELSDAALNILSFRTYSTFGNDPVGQIQSLTVAQIRALSPAQVRMIGAAGPGGSVTTSQIQFLNAGAWAALVSNPTQVAAITPAEVQRFSGSQIIAFGTNIKDLSDEALNALSYRTYVDNGNDPVGQIQSLTVAQIGALTPSQISIIANISTDPGPNTAIAWLNAGAFSALKSTQVAVLTPTNVRLVTATQLASLTTTAIAGFTPATIASFTASQKAALNNAQRAACNC